MLTAKKLNRIVKILGEEKIQSLEQGQVAELKVTIAGSSGVIKETQDSLEANVQYQELKENLKAISVGFKEVKTFQNAIIQYCLHLIEEREAKE